MKIVDRPAFLDLREGTVYGMGGPRAFGSLSIQGASVANRDWWYIELCWVERRIAEAKGHGRYCDRGSRFCGHGIGSKMKPRHREGATAIIRDCRGNFLLQRRDNIPGIMSPGMISLFGGHRDGHESFIHCLIRELNEELSCHLEPERCELLEVYVGQNLDAPDETVESHVFLVRGLSAETVTVMEGTLALFTPAEALARNDLAPMTAMALTKYSGRPTGPS